MKHLGLALRQLGRLRGWADGRPLGTVPV